MAESTEVDDGAEHTSSSPTRRVVVVRHGERQDEADDSWSKTADEPWDPPLSKNGREQALEAGRRILEDRGVVIRRVVTSPFLRCLETTAMLLEALDLPWGICTIDCRFSEVLSSGVLLRGSAAGSGALEGGKGGQPGEDWLWRGQGLEERLTELLPPGASHEVCFAASALPAAEETHGAAHGRYCHAFESLMGRSDEAPQQQASDAEPADAVLVVTHGEGVRAAVDMAVPRALVYEVLHCGFVGFIPGQPSRGGSAPGTDAAVPAVEGVVAADGPGQDQGGSAPPSEHEPPPLPSAPPAPPHLATAQDEGPAGAEAAAERQGEGQGVLPPEETKAERVVCPSSGSADNNPSASGTGRIEDGTDSRPDEADGEGIKEHAEASGGGDVGTAGGAPAGSEGEGEQRDPEEEGEGLASLPCCWEVEFSDGVSWLVED